MLRLAAMQRLSPIQPRPAAPPALAASPRLGVAPLLMSLGMALLPGCREDSDGIEGDAPVASAVVTAAVDARGAAFPPATVAPPLEGAAVDPWADEDPFADSLDNVPPAPTAEPLGGGAPEAVGGGAPGGGTPL